jgi:hypothetical protein
MKQLLLLIGLIMLLGCSKKPDEPYYDRAKQASKQAHEQLQRD